MPTSPDHRRLCRLIESAPVAMWEVDPQSGKILYISPQIEALTGRPPAHWVDRTSWLASVHPADRERMVAFSTTIKPGTRWHTVDYRLLHAKGQVVYLRELMDVEWQGDVAVALLGCTVDVTAGRLADDRLRASEARFRTAFDANPASMAITQISDGTYLDVNQSFLDALGYQRDQVIGHSSLDLGLWADPADRQRMVRGLRQDGRVDNLYADLVGASGCPCHCLMSARVIVMDGEPAILSVTQDVTAQRQLDQRHQQLERLQALGTLAGGLAHDFNNALTGIGGNLSLLQLRLGADPGAQELLDEAAAAVRAATRLTRQLLTFASGGEPVKQGLALSEILRQALDSLETDSAVVVKLSVDPKLWVIQADRSQLAQVLRNLTLNAVDAMPTGGRLTVTAQNHMAPGPQGPLTQVELHVIDTGTGIAADKLAHIFEPYFGTKGRGGLGLSVVHSVITRHGGSITLQSTPGRGTDFCVRLPAEGRSAATESRPAVGEGAALVERVLVMDDEAVLRRLMVRMLTHLGCQAHAVPDGETALAAFRQAQQLGQPYQAVIMDLTVPGGMGGAQAIGPLRQLDDHVLAIVSSGYSDDAVMADYRRYGFDAALPKPHSLQDLRDALRSGLASQAGPASQA